MRAVRIYHSGRDAAHRARERALVEAGARVRLIVPASWPGTPDTICDEAFDIVQLEVRRPGDVNRHRYADIDALRRAVQEWQPDVIDAHEEPVSLAGRQCLAVARDTPLVMYTAQNLDKRWPPPYGHYERAALRRAQAFYPCSRQAASVLRGKGYLGHIDVLPLGVDETVHQPGQQSWDATEWVLGMVGRLVPGKGLADAIEALAAVRRARPARLVVVGGGPDESAGRTLASHLGVAEHVHWYPWADAAELSELYRSMHVVLVPSRATATWVEQFGRVLTEGGANGVVSVGYASGSVPEVTADTGLVVPEGDVDGLSTAVLGLAQDEDAWTSLRARAVARATELNWRNVAQQQVRLYERACRAPAPLQLHPGRAGAQRDYGPPARTALSDRPFALPILRSSQLAHAWADRWEARGRGSGGDDAC